MQYREDIEMIKRFTDKIQDTESEKLFDARFSYFIDRDKESFYEKLDGILMNKKCQYHCWRLESYYRRNPQNRENGIIVFGAGEMGRLTCRSLQYVNKKAMCLCDNNANLYGTEYRGIPVYDFAYVCQHYKDNIVIVAVTDRYQQACVYHQLILAGFRESDILMSDFGGVFCDIPDQYFDVDEVCPDKDGEYFVDAGCCNGSTAVQCSKAGRCSSNPNIFRKIRFGL